MKRFIFGGLLLLLITTQAVAQRVDQTAQDNAKQNQDQLYLQELNRQRFEDVRKKELYATPEKLGEVETVPTPDFQEGELPEFMILEINVEGVTKLTPHAISQIITPYLGKRLTVNEINAVISKITNLYIELGFTTTRAYLPKQNLKSQQLVIQVVEGKIEEIVSDELSFLQLEMCFPLTCPQKTRQK